MSKNNLRLCCVNGRLGYFHEWVCNLQSALPISIVFGIVEFDDGVRLVNMSDIKFCDNIHEELYCPRCSKELIRNGKLFRIVEGGILECRCSKCGNVSFWDFAHFPAPVLRTCGDCEYLEYYNTGETYCEKDLDGLCSPYNQKEFVYKKG